MTENFPFKKETYDIIGLCMEVQRTLGFGFSEAVYKDAMEMEFISNNILYSREPELRVFYKGNQLKRRYSPDFLNYDEIVIEVKSSEKGIIDDYIAQTLNYLKASRKIVGLIVNFGKRKLEYKRLIFS